LNLIFEGKSFSGVNDYSNTNSWIKGGSRWETYGLNITYQKLPDHTDTCLSDNTKTYVQVFEFLSVDVLQAPFDNYLDINFKAGSAISILKLRNSNLRLVAGEPTFVSGGYAWLRGQAGQANLKLLCDVQTINGFIPAFPNSFSGVETTSSTFSANALEFLDSKIDASVLLAYPPNNSAVSRKIKRTFKFTPKSLTTGVALESFSTRIASNRKLFGGYGGTAGATVLHDLYAAANGLSQVVEVYHATNHNTDAIGANANYKNATVYKIDKEITVKIRKAGYKEFVDTTNTYLGEFAFSPAMTPDTLYSYTLSSIVTVNNAKQMYDVVQQYLQSNLAVDIDLTLIDRTITTTHNVVFDASATALVTFGNNTLTIKASSFDGNLTTTGTATFVNGAGIVGTLEDVNGVRVTVRKSGGGNFNMAARKGTTGAYTDLGFQFDVSSATYTVPKGTPVEVVMWSLGCVTYTRTINTTDGGVALDAGMTVNSSINTALDVSSYLANISLSLDTSGATPFFVITFNAAMTVSGIEPGKALVHRLVGQEVALRSGFPPGSTSTIVINADEITNQLPAVRLDVGAAVPVTGRVYLDFFINMVAAQALNPSYAINPPRADGNQVQILRAKPALDASQLSAAVWSASQRTLTSASTARPSIDF
jgi:hypothetical protein